MTRSQFSQRDLSHTVVVGVDGSEDNLGALRFAATEAAALGAALKVVHVVPDHLPSAAVMPPTPDEIFAAGHEILRAARGGRPRTRARPSDRVVPPARHPSAPARVGSRGRDDAGGREGRPLADRAAAARRHGHRGRGPRRGARRRSTCGVAPTPGRRREGRRGRRRGPRPERDAVGGRVHAGRQATGDPRRPARPKAAARVQRRRRSDRR